MDGATDRACGARRLLGWWGAAQVLRVRVEAAQDALLHFAALPTRKDLRRVQAGLRDVRARVDTLERAVARVEAAVGARGEE
jgi:hypothetical protein